MNIEEEFTEALLHGYKTAGEEVGYWGKRYLQSIRRNGGLATAKRMLLPRNAGQRMGLDALIEANRPDLTVEAIILREQFRPLFTNVELEAARTRLGEYGRQIAAVLAHRERLYPDELPSGTRYVEGAKKQVRVNAYERNPRARKVCIEHYGLDCAVCGFNFAARFPELGIGFIHIHHLRPLSLTDGAYELDPIEDLRPVCPNCHAMLHRKDPPLSIEELRGQMVLAGG